MTDKQKCCVLLLLAVILALGLRLPRLAERPMHGDEAIHAEKFGQLLEQGTYRYNPNEYHGPTLNYFTLIPAKLQGIPIISINNSYAVYREWKSLTPRPKYFSAALFQFQTCISWSFSIFPNSY